MRGRSWRFGSPVGQKKENYLIISFENVKKRIIQKNITQRNICLQIPEPD
jgi:hypothetical protein